AWRAARATADPTVLTAPQRGLVRAMTWFALVFVVFSVMPPKRELYLLPIYPAAAWFAAIAFERALATGRLAAWAGYSTTGLVLLLGLAVGIAPRISMVLRPYAAATTPIAFAFVIAAGAALAFLRRGNLARWA